MVSPGEMSRDQTSRNVEKAGRKHFTPPPPLFFIYFVRSMYVNNHLHIQRGCLMSIPHSVRWAKRGGDFLQNVGFDFFWNLVLRCHLELIKFPFIYSNLILGCILTLIILEMTLCKELAPYDSWPHFHHRHQQRCGCPWMLLHKLLWLTPVCVALIQLSAVSVQLLNMPFWLHQDFFSPMPEKKGTRQGSGRR